MIHSKLSHRGMPSADKILAYWKHRLKIYKKICFACGAPFRLHRAHIIPLNVGGTHDLDNLHLLCTPCHVESEDLKVYDTWFNWQRKHRWQDEYGHVWDRLQKLGLTHKKLMNYGKENDFDMQKTCEDVFDDLLWNHSPGFIM